MQRWRYAVVGGLAFLAAGLGALALPDDGSDSRLEPGKPVGPPLEPSYIAGVVIDEDPPAGTLNAICIFEGVEDDRRDVYRCHARYPGDSISIRLERERSGSIYRWQVLSSVDPDFEGKRGECDAAEGQPCLE